jgi:hypothetical protein
VVGSGGPNRAPTGLVALAFISSCASGCSIHLDGGVGEQRILEDLDVVGARAGGVQQKGLLHAAHTLEQRRGCGTAGLQHLGDLVHGDSAITQAQVRLLEAGGAGAPLKQDGGAGSLHVYGALAIAAASSHSICFGKHGLQRLGRQGAAGVLACGVAAARRRAQPPRRTTRLP